MDVVKDSRILITECTFFIQEHKERAKAGKHTHVDELANMLGKMNNEYIVLTHFTQRTHIREAINILRAKLPDDIFKKIIILMDQRDSNG